jgi:hypothetical protein
MSSTDVMGTPISANGMGQHEAANGCAIVVFTSRESPGVVMKCIDSIVAGVGPVPATIDIIVNGNGAAASALRDIGRTVCKTNGQDVKLRVWEIVFGDKANAWNQYVHDVWPSSGITFFVDGYVRLCRDAISSVMSTLANAPETVYGATGIPVSGKSSPRLAREMTTYGGIHGNFYALRRSAMDELRRRKFKLPVGLYRTDGVLGAVLAYRFDPNANGWNADTIIVEPSAKWSFEALRWWSPRDLLVHLRRMQRQAQGQLENRATRDHLSIRRQAPERLPGTAEELVIEWSARSPGEFRKACIANPLCLLAMRRTRTRRSAGERSQHVLRVDVR